MISPDNESRRRYRKHEPGTHVAPSGIHYRDLSHGANARLTRADRIYRRNIGNIPEVESVRSYPLEIKLVLLTTFNAPDGSAEAHESVMEKIYDAEEETNKAIQTGNIVVENRPVNLTRQKLAEDIANQLWGVRRDREINVEPLDEEE